MAAKDRKRTKPTAQTKISHRRASHVRIFQVDPARNTKKQKPKSSPEYVRETTRPLRSQSIEADFMEMKPEGVSPIEWLRVFTPERELWEFLQEEAWVAVHAGERIS